MNMKRKVDRLKRVPQELSATAVVKMPFVEETYLARSADVVAAVMTEEFTEQEYLRANPDVADAVKRKEMVSGLAHWQAFGKKEGRQLSMLERHPLMLQEELPHPLAEDRFVTRAPNSQNIIDVFQGEWSSRMPHDSKLLSKPGHADLFNDPRVLWVEQELGPVKGKSIVELGPLEGAHSYMFERLGAQSVTAIESNPRSFLKCLCVKEVFKLKRVDFLLGDFLPYLDSLDKVDLIFASGVLYHMVDPIRLLNLICSKTDKFFLWTHYFDADVISKHPNKDLFSDLGKINGTDSMGSKRLYPEVALSWKGFSGGAHSYAVWLERNSLLSFIKEKGFKIKITDDHADHPNGPALSICATRVI